MGPHEDDTVDVLAQGRKVRVRLHPAIKAPSLRPEQELVLNEALNVDVVVLKERLDDDALPADRSAELGALRLTDSAAFGTGLHPTTAMCLAAIEEALQHSTPGILLDVGIGSGVLALAALLIGVPRALGLDIDAEALRAAAENARLNGLDRRLHLTRGGPDAVAGTWPLVVANLLAAPLVELAPVLARRVGHHGRLVLSGIPSSVEPDVDRTYRRLGMQHVRAQSRAGWTAL